MDLEDDEFVIHINWMTLFGGAVLAVSLTGLWWLLLWCGVEGYRHTNDWVNALLRIGQ